MINHLGKIISLIRYSLMVGMHYVDKSTAIFFFDKFIHVYKGVPHPCCRGHDVSPQNIAERLQLNTCCKIFNRVSVIYFGFLFFSIAAVFVSFLPLYHFFLAIILIAKKYLHANCH